MDSYEIMNIVEAILEETSTAVLASTDSEGKPHMRWLTPAILKGRAGAIFAVTSPHFAWVSPLRTRPDVEWMIQTPTLNTIITARGKINVLDNPAIKSEILQAIGSKLNVFWKVNTRESDFLVLETIIAEAIHFAPMKGEKIVVKF